MEAGAIKNKLNRRVMSYCHASLTTASGSDVSLKEAKVQPERPFKFLQPDLD